MRSEPSTDQPLLPSGLPEDWVFDRDLECPQCRYNLRMLHTPRCPECGTAFRWQALLHIGCPRCGESLRESDDAQCPDCKLEIDWQRLLADAPAANRRLYEYAERPLRAGARGSFAVLLPGRFWSSVPLELPPAVRRLKTLRRVGNLVCAIGLAALLEAAFKTQSIGAWWTTCALVVGLPVLTALTLPRFTPTLARFRIRRDQLLRCWAYGSFGRMWIGLLFIGASVWGNARPSAGPAFWWFLKGPHFDLFSFVAVLSDGVGQVSWRWLGLDTIVIVAVGVLFLSLALVWWWRFLYASLRRYLRLNRRNAVALFLATQTVALLVLAVLLSLLLPFTRDGLWLLART